MCTLSPVMVEPDFVELLVTMIPMYAGSGPAGGGVLLPGSVDQPPPQAGSLGVSAKPLKLDDAAVPLIKLILLHWAPQNVTAVPVALSLSPMAKAPPPGAKV